MSVKRDRRGRIHSSADVFAMHRRQMARLARTSPEQAGSMPAPSEPPAWGGHECDRGGRLNGWPICWRCWVDAMLARLRALEAERGERERGGVVDWGDVA